MSARLSLPDGRSGDPPILDGEAFTRLLAVLADHGDTVALPAAAEARGEPVPLVVIDRPGVFAAGALLRSQFNRALPALRSRSISFRLAGEQDAEIDFGDGAGPRTVAPGADLAVELSSGDAAEITVRRDDRTARCTIPLNLDPAPVPGETWPLPGGTAWTLTAPGHDAVRCPLVVVEGFPGGHGFLYSHDVVAQHGLLSSLQALGHDLIVVGLEDGTRPLQENAAVVRAALAEVAARSKLPVTLVGWSMGGLLARLAVAAAEAAGERHLVETIVTLDTPHRGTMTQLGVQWFVERFASEHPALRLNQRLLQSSANREMDMLVVGAAGGAQIDPAREALLASLTWPRTARQILVASGRGDGRVSLEPGQVILHWSHDGQGELCLRTVGGEHPVAAGWAGELRPDPLEVPGAPAWDGAPGGRGTYVKQTAALLIDLAGGRATPSQPPLTCIVPTVSALDLDAPPEAPVPPRPDLICCATDQPHVVIDAAAAAALRARIGAPFDPDRFDPHDPAFLADPFPAYSRFRQFAPIHPLKLYDSLWCFRARDCRAILKDTETWLKHPPGAAAPTMGPMAALDGLPPGLFSSDPPAHPILRGAVEKPLTESLGSVAQSARDHAARLLAALGPTERIELVQDYALPLPAHVLFDLLGIADDPVLRMSLIGWQQAIAIAHDVTQAPAARLQGATCAMALRGFFAGLVERHRRSPQPGLIGQVCDAFGAAGVGDTELVGTLCDLLVAGYLSTTFIIATGLWRLLSAGADVGALLGDGERAAETVEELLRLDGPVQVIDRFTAVPTSLDGRELPAGTKVTAVVGAADRDPEAFEAPDELRPGRGPAHMAFGAGIHLCVGAPLARRVAPVALHALARFAPDLALDGEPQWQTDPYLRAAVSVPLALGSRRG